MTRFIFFDNAINVTEDRRSVLTLQQLKPTEAHRWQELLVEQPFIWVFLFLYIAISAYVILNLASGSDGQLAHVVLRGKCWFIVSRWE